MEKVRIFGDWANGSIWTEDRTSLTVVGSVVKDLVEGSDYRLQGRMVNHPEYGEQLEVSSALPHIKPNARSIAKYMAANFHGIGQKSAERMVQHAINTGGPDQLERLRQQLLNEPWAVDWTPANREGTYSADKDETIVEFVNRDLTTRLSANQGMTAPVLKLISKWLVERRNQPEFEKSPDPVADCWRILASNPYAPIKNVPGYGFFLADMVGRQVNIPLNSPQRLAALVAYALKQGCDMAGHVFLTQAQFVANIQQVDRVINPSVAIEHGLSEETVVLDDSRGERRYYTPALLKAEDEVANAVFKMMTANAPLMTDVKGIEDKIQAAFRQGKQNASKFSLDPSQVAAVRSAITSPSRIHLITGGPGCGKTSLVETEVNMLPGRVFHFAAPTGKAAKMLWSRIASTGHQASTIHSLLKGSDKGWGVDKENPLKGDIFVVDEGSMPPLELYKAILDACNKNMHLIVLGDPNQLQSIQPGCTLADLISLPGINHAHLTTVHRNGGGILEVVGEIARGEISCEDRPDVTFSHGLGEAEEFFPVVMQTYLDAVARRGVENVIFMMSRRQGKPSEPGWNVTYANAVLRDMMNPHADKLPGTSNLHVGDRIIIRENMSIVQKKLNKDDDEREERVVNGDTGTILSYERFAAGSKSNGVEWLRIKLDDGRTIDYPGDALRQLDHSYAMTVHACQGSEYQEVIGVFTPGSPAFINRSTLFTAASRPRAHMHFFAEDHVLRKIAATPPPRRNSALAEKVREMLGDDQVETDEEVATTKRRFRMAA